jgi:hypothetical protein
MRLVPHDYETNLTRNTYILLPSSGEQVSNDVYAGQVTCLLSTGNMHLCSVLGKLLYMVCF